ncbi:unnamed protein product [Adineta steineri]|nr:unnamed protein product [Adineta steineri]CAF3737695.1 unnamed protein product [Adineta steineri]CAF3963615.1 unnamed protein product [Adineta steineri]
MLIFIANDYADAFPRNKIEKNYANAKHLREFTDQLQRNDNTQLSPNTILLPIKRLVLLLAGSFHPVTIGHLRMPEIARDYYRLHSIQLLEVIISPVNEFYNKTSLTPATHRIEMLRAAIYNDNKWLSVDTWEAEQPFWTPVNLVLDHHYKIIKQRYGEDTELRLLTGSDLVQEILNPTKWSPKVINYIMRTYGVTCITRLSDTEVNRGDSIIEYITKEMPNQWKRHVEFIVDTMTNDISSTKVRAQLAEGCSVKYIVPDAVIAIIYYYGLYNSTAPISLVT